MVYEFMKAIMRKDKSQLIFKIF